jgi:ferredoxin-NADP reductase
MSSQLTAAAESPQARPAARTRLRDRAWRVAELATTPLLPADYLDLLNPLRPGAELRGRIESVHHETADAATLVIRPGADWAGHVPGQYVRVGVDVDGVRQWRAYSLTHGPRADGRISITVKAVPGGTVSEHLVHRVRAGTLLHLEQAAGDFVLPPDGGRFLFVTAGSGITPVIGMLRNLFPVTDSGAVRLPRSDGYDIVVVHVAPSEPQSIFLDNLRALDDTGLIRLVAHYDDQHGRTCASGRPSPAVRQGSSRRSRRITPTSACPCSPSSSAWRAWSLETAARSPSPGRGRRWRRTQRRRSSTPRRPRESSCPPGAGWGSATAACCPCARAPSATCATAS